MMMKSLSKCDRPLTALLLLAAALIPFAASAAPLSELEGSRPNIILLITDDQGYAPVGKHGHPWIKTPNLDALYDKSMRFDRFHVAPTCAPTRSALMSGRHPMKNGVTHTILEHLRQSHCTQRHALALKNGMRHTILHRVSA